MKGLLIRSPWIDLILSHKKTWEMRSRRTNQRGVIGLIKAGSGMVYGTAELLDCLAPLSPARMRETRAFHAIPEPEIAGAIERRWTIPWVLGRVNPLDAPVPYKHPSGAVTWVDLPDSLLACAAAHHHAPAIAPSRTPSTTRAEHFEKARDERPAMHPAGQPTDWADIPLTDGNIRHGHFYLRSAERLLPADCIGGPSKATAGSLIRVRFDPGVLIETDVAGDKMILRARSAVREFFSWAAAKAGDSVRFARLGDRDFLVTLIRPDARASD